MDDLEEDLTCSVCYSLFCDPRVLPCSHTFCKACLDNVQQVSGAFSTWRLLRVPLKCPNCRSVVELPPTGVEALPANVSLRAIIEKYQRDSWPRPPFCPQHPLQPLNVYCVQDRQLICGLCLTVGGHQGHAIDDLQAALARERAAARLGLEQTLARKRHAFSAALDAAEAELGREYEPILERLKGMKEEQLELLSHGAAVAEEEAPLAYLQKVHALRERVEALMDTPLPQVRPLCVCPRAADFLEQQWAGVTLSELEQRPVPRIACCHDSRHRKEAPPPCPEAPHLSAALLIGLLALLISLCLGLIGFPQVFEQAVRDAALCLASLAANLQLQSTSLLSSLSDTAAQYLASIAEILFVW
ncbi:hypothetical protein ANANG_G00241870 [Anguilla anguilla]|uniref:Tripartite motif-containing protein 59 n=1 Tax=Anguilla anguilla TaxID=7936 RepID=A0A9D3LWU7_ANGAN|nr:hypothetical protein ANANG_G00241870 [Anguilla anguilla]